MQGIPPDVLAAHYGEEGMHIDISFNNYVPHEMIIASVVAHKRIKYVFMYT